MQPAYLKNSKTGVVMAYTKLLGRQGHLIPCDEHGNPLASYDAIPDDGVARDKRKAPFLVNEKTGVLVPYTGLLARQPHLHPCDTREEGAEVYARIRAARLGEDPEAVNTEAPRAPQRFKKDADGVQSSYGTKGARVARDADYQLPAKGETESRQEEVAPVDEPETVPDTPVKESKFEHDLDAMTRKQLRDLAKEHGETLDHRATAAVMREQVRVILMQAC